MRRLTEIERSRIQLLINASIETSLLEVTETGLKKGIMDATIPFRNYLLEQDIHDFGNQKQGPSYKEVIPATILTRLSSYKTKMSLYRPETKKGDPRVWIYGLNNHATPKDIIATFNLQNHIYVLNITQEAIELDLTFTNEISRTHPRNKACEQPSPRCLDLFEQVSTPNALNEILSRKRADTTETSKELLHKLKKIAAIGPIRTVRHGDTAVGFTLETALGIAANSSKSPDYKGIELKSYRKNNSGKDKNRKTLFAKVPNWEISKFKSSREILSHFGYESGADFKLYCTVSTQTINSQGLSLAIDYDNGLLTEHSSNNECGEFACWSLKELRKQLLEKHNETFWIEAKSEIEQGVECFSYTKILHTRKPIASAFDLLLERGDITLDHLIKRNPKGRVSEKGPLFKIRPEAFPLLFPEQATYKLTS
ncbi:MvaI/BcnI family restriction endonuclease [Amphritea sp. HPY]|uniref:MvaI/BcnI family restriction endonuclease n=1 Tax=Amphritea sp. HPY TaxID=3421652 RepID=UPI003D7D533B